MLAQHNMDVAVPFVVSTRNYGVLWDNNSITRFGDPRPYGLASRDLKLYDAEGKPGGLTARYYVDGQLRLSRPEATSTTSTSRICTTVRPNCWARAPRTPAPSTWISPARPWCGRASWKRA